MLPNEVNFTIENGMVIFKDLPEDGQLRKIGYASQNLATLKSLSISSINITAAKLYASAIRSVTKETDAHLFDAALLSAIVKYGSAFKADSRGFKIEPKKIFTDKIRIVDRSLHPQEIIFDDPNYEMLGYHKRFIALRDKFIPHDDQFLEHTGLFAIFEKEFRCDRVFVLTERSSVYSAIKEYLIKLPMCIDAVFTWLAFEKERYCDIVTKEINALRVARRQAFPPPAFEEYRGLPDGEARAARNDPTWVFDWQTGSKVLRDI
jgi:hypothetical protein